MFCLLDGHGGSIVAKYASKHLHKYVIQRPEFPEDIPAALKQVCIFFITNSHKIKEINKKDKRKNIT